MPIYEYKCGKCGAEFEKLVFGSTKITCSKCGSEEVRKKLSVCGFSGLAKPWDNGPSSSSSGCSSCSKSSCSGCH